VNPERDVWIEAICFDALPSNVIEGVSLNEGTLEDKNKLWPQATSLLYEHGIEFSHRPRPYRTTNRTHWE
jgi:hypothetical protein